MAALNRWNSVERSVPVHEQRRLQIAKATAGLFENSRLPMWIYDLRTLSFLAVNDAAVECYGYSREEFLAMTVRQLHLPAERSALLDQVLKSPVFSALKRTWQHVKRDGTVIYVEVARSAVDSQARTPAWSTPTMSPKARDPSCSIGC
jgi:PAS domain S-box-containing protein